MEWKENIVSTQELIHRAGAVARHSICRVSRVAICSLFALACIATSQGQQRMLPKTTGVSQIETEMVTISPAGAEPKAITREATPFFLYVKLAENFAPQADLAIVPAAPLPDGRQLSGIVNQQALARTH